MRRLGVDLGFSQVKMVSEKEGYKFPSIIGYPSAIELKDHAEGDSILSDISIEHKGTRYYVGEKAIRDTRNSQLTFTADKTDNKSDRVKFFTCLGLALGETDKGDFEIVTGLPVDEFAGVGGLKEKVKSNMEGVFVFTFRNRQKEAHIRNVTVIPQSAGAYYDHIMEESGTILPSRVKKKALVLDIGFRTTDAVTMLNARYSPQESFTIHAGVSDVHKEAKRRLMKHHHIQKDITGMDGIIRSRTIHVGGRDIDFTEHVIEAVMPVAERIVSEIPMYIQNMAEIHEVLLTGGGASLMGSRITYEMGRYGIPVTLLPSPEFGNARGYLKYGNFLSFNRRN